MRALVVDGSDQSADILCSILSAFGLRNIVRASNGKEAQAEIRLRPFDLVLTDGLMSEMDGYDLIHWLRREPGDARMTPAIVISAHTPGENVLKARDCGANYTITKPISPSVVLERIIWVSRTDRMFIESDGYKGPDRRCRNMGPPVEHPDGRRRDDEPAAVSTLAGDNLSGAELDLILKPQRLAG